MMKYKKTIIAPVVAFVALVVKIGLGVEISEELQSEIAGSIANVAILATIVYGIITNHDEEDKEKS